MIGLKEIQLKKEMELMEQQRIKRLQDKISSEFYNYTMFINFDELTDYFNIVRIQLCGFKDIKNPFALRLYNLDDKNKYAQTEVIRFKDDICIIEIKDYHAYSKAKQFTFNINSNKLTRFKVYKNIYRYIATIVF